MSHISHLTAKRSQIYLLPQSIQYNAQNHPNQAAFKCLNNAITYQKLDEKTNQLAHWLIEKGIQKGDRIGVFMNRCLESAIAIYGIMKAGAAYVPLDPSAPADRIRFVMNDCAISIILTTKGQRRQLKEVIAEPSSLQYIFGCFLKNEDYQYEDWTALERNSITPPKVNILGQDLAYIMYTSGSTGQPKGIMHTHDSGLAYAKLSAALYDLNKNDIIANHAPLHFDISTLGYFTSMYVGATTIIVSDAHTKMPASLSQLIENEKITIWYSVPLALIQLLQRGVLEERDCSSIRWVLFGGEVFPTKHLRAIMQQWSQARFCNVYGPAEVNQCTYYHLDEPPQEDDAIPIGYIWNNTEGIILDENDEVIDHQGVGELLIRSATRMQGYWNRPDLTAKGFFRQRDSSGFERIFYRTGDLVQRNAKGELLFLGRKDRQIKTRGYRVELDAVTAVLLSHEAVAEAAVYSIKNEADETAIEAALLLKDGETLDLSAIKKIATEKLPLYARPQAYRILDEFPRGATGKIDFKQLQQETSQNLI
ncbi:MAG: amino acid adenylation domain-containing protein [Bacteroidota bacterium]